MDSVEASVSRGSYEREWPGPIPEVKKICIDQKNI